MTRRVRPTRIATERLKPCMINQASAQHVVRPTRIATERLKLLAARTRRRILARQTDPNRDRAIETSSTLLVMRDSRGQTDPNRDRAIETLLGCQAPAPLVRPTRIATLPPHPAQNGYDPPACGGLEIHFRWQPAYMVTGEGLLSALGIAAIFGVIFPKLAKQAGSEQQPDTTSAEDRVTQ